MAKQKLADARALIFEEEKNTLLTVIDFYCNRKHGTKGEICLECNALKAYATKQLDNCIFLLQKPTCAQCPLHCYSPERRQQIRKVMRYAAPRFYFLHPYKAFKHIWHSLQAPSAKVQEVSRRLKKKIKKA
ncbi:MAG: nitrous oxide-stimulated promoter family protein [Anaerolineaceae bacterium]|nr:nitrous oxide-stimulated promoter family protein [Anaerolineaceae bacterium]